MPASIQVGVEPFEHVTVLHALWRGQMDGGEVDGKMRDAGR